ncbi:SDR family NAD(P)-dependent oxidoreductase [Cryomorphaceae bacterium]|nr:SDR family NAD(P)-dependent oxidoreductase [Cryomorphaceae bacterium]
MPVYNPETLHLPQVIQNHKRDLSGQIAAVTGTTSGTGFVCARELAKLGAHVILLNRESDRSAAALAKLQEAVPNGSFEAVACDLQDFASVRDAAAAIRTKHDRLDILVNNAGVMALQDLATKDGYDVQIQTNVISHFLLTRDLLSLLEKSEQARIVNHTSMARLGPPLESMYFEARGGDLGGDGTKEENDQFQGPRWSRYHQTKLANCVFNYGLKTKLEAAGKNNILCMIAHPGLSATNLQVTTAAVGGMDGDSDFMSRAQSAEDGAGGIVRASIDPEAQSGDFYGPTAGWQGYPDKLEPEENLSDPGQIELLWSACEAAVGPFEIA